MRIYISILGVVVLLGGLSFASQAIQRPETIVVEEVSVATKETIQIETGARMEMNTPVFADGTYTTSFAYEIPYKQIEPMEVSLVFKDGVITEAEVLLEAENFTSEEYQNWFLEYYKDEVVGQLIDVVSLARVGGASLTNKAFDVALAAAKAEASGQEIVTPEIVPLEVKVYEHNSAVGSLEDVSFKDGTYTVEDAYFVMAGLSEPMRTTVTLADGVITDASVAFDTQDIHSEYHQRDFSAVYKTQVIGAEITDVPFSRIGGASLTTGGFNDALEKVMSQAIET
jgi:hypothetical protein